MQPPRHPLAVLVPVLALSLAACSTDQADPADEDSPTGPVTSPSPPATASPSPSPTEATDTPPAADSPTPSPTSSPAPTSTAAGVPSLSGLCELEAPGTPAERVEFAVPDGWRVEEDSCEFFDPALEQLEEGTEPDAAVSVHVAESDFATVSDTEEIGGEIRHVGARSGHQAVRIRGEGAGQALRPEGEPVQLWLVDLDAGTDDQGGTLVIHASASSGASFDLAARAADRMAETLRVVPPAVDDDLIVVTRTEGGGTPWAVTFDPAAGCFHLRPGGPTDTPADEACDVGAPSGGVTGAILTDGDREVVAGLAPPQAILVESDAATAPYGAVTTSLEGASAFAYEAIIAPVEVRAVDVAGETLATGTLG